ncbi:TPA: DUF2513 domain-containing protein [Vibrio parahaemolyticus]|uniref:DUF2513 domain-containing protein n=1 Tax=Vibrio parahaemolyticus TaxID=670 RepID=UPI0005419696|nr:DUF2513 domain-containing protein [Vibrio parahaemolyticus]EIE1198943.1 DUF2513 domain-containing protein [Vibrio parahaemolyticus]EIU6756886.1 DUF2513 domain-containing protein [Vibrio parahaemolyticus]EIZ1043164.1 DUF2513 domain-containing protein [Vibrio parahaemolyticus]EJC6989826.1 DUF2513 domain-containing protein [Vibrio parahaemolyticus]EJG1904255.1 DUF2513 domain-containing protein [Vibrio parahaemolyticus]
MERSWDTVREILLKIEQLEPNAQLTLNDFDKERGHEIAYHIKLLESAGLIEVALSKTISQAPTDFFAKSMTWSGHEFLDSIRVESTWEKTKSLISQKGGVMTFDVIKSVAASMIGGTLA